MISIALSEKHPEKTLHDLHYFRATAEKMKKPNLPTDRDGKPWVLTSSEKPQKTPRRTSRPPGTREQQHRYAFGILSLCPAQQSVSQ